MAFTLLRPTVRVATLATAGAATIYTANKLYTSKEISPFRTIHAESLPSDSRAALAKMPWKGFTELKLQSAEMVNHNVRRLTFALPSEDTVTGLSPVTSLLTRHTPDGAWIPVFRPYTPISDPSQPGTVTFLVKKYPNGKGSGKMHSMAPGDTLLFKPLAEYTHEPNKYNSVLMIAGGSGITPLYQLTNAILNNPADKTTIALVYANNTENDILLRSELEQLEKKFPGRFKKVFTVKTKSSSATDVQQGYVTKETIGKIWPGVRQEGQKVLVSGPPAMTENLAGAKSFFGWFQGSTGGVLKELGYTKEDVHKF